MLIYQVLKMWSLTKSLGQNTNRLSGCLTKSCIRIAQRINTQHRHYAARRPDPFAKIIDAFSFNWGTEKCYIFPPFSLIARVLQKVRTDATTVLAVLPKWPTQAWWPEARSMMVGEPHIIPPGKGVLHLPNHPRTVHALHKKLHLMVCLLSGKPT